MNVNQNIYIQSATNRQPSTIGNIIALLLALSIVAAALYVVYFVSATLLGALGYGLEAIAAAVAGVSGWIGVGASALAGVFTWAGVYEAFGVLAQIVAVVGGSICGVYLLAEGIAYARSEQRHRHAMQMREGAYTVLPAERIAAAHTTHLLPVAQQETIGITAEAKLPVYR